ncbi:hypothetical protein ACJX0J_006370, partial [Zea mays]
GRAIIYFYKKMNVFSVHSSITQCFLILINVAYSHYIHFTKLHLNITVHRGWWIWGGQQTLCLWGTSMEITCLPLVSTGLQMFLGDLVVRFRSGIAQMLMPPFFYCRSAIDSLEMAVIIWGMVDLPLMAQLDINLGGVNPNYDVIDILKNELAEFIICCFFYFKYCCMHNCMQSPQIIHVSSLIIADLMN